MFLKGFGFLVPCVACSSLLDRYLHVDTLNGYVSKPPAPSRSVPIVFGNRLLRNVESHGSTRPCHSNPSHRKTPHSGYKYDSQAGSGKKSFRGSGHVRPDRRDTDHTNGQLQLLLPRAQTHARSWAARDRQHEQLVMVPGRVPFPQLSLKQSSAEEK